LIAVAAIGCCIWGMAFSARVALSKIFITYAAKSGNLAAANEAVRLAAGDAESHLVRGELLKFSSLTNEALPELERAVTLRPRDYYLWMELGLTRDELDDGAGALAAFNKAVELAPFYGQPRWLRGNLLLRNGKFDDAFVDLRQAAKSNPALLPNVIDLAWGSAKHNASLAGQLAGISSDRERLLFAEFLANRGSAPDALIHFREVRTVPPEMRRRLVGQLIANGSYQEAFTIWNNFDAGGSNPPEIRDGGFEGPLRFDAAGFDWNISRAASAAKLALNVVQPHSGSKSLQLEFHGEPPVDKPLLSQLLFIDAPGRYRILFAARTQELVAGSRPLIVVSDARNKSRRLGESAPLGQVTQGWQTFGFEFTTEPDTRAVMLSLEREPCSALACPIFGSLWLDSFSIQPVP